MNFTRMLSLTAALGITVAQWTLCLGLFLYTQPVTAVSREPADKVSRSSMPEIDAIGHLH
jgi:hypothetical protein